MTKLLLVEDNDDNREMLSRRLIRQGFESAFAVDGFNYDTKPVSFPRPLGKLQAALAHSREAQS
jgi:CheY-like chemotaxis protein